MKYPAETAYSIHMELTRDSCCKKLHNDYGILFPEADINADNVIVPAYLAQPLAARDNDGYRIFGFRLELKDREFKNYITMTEDGDPRHSGTEEGPAADGSGAFSENIPESASGKTSSGLSEDNSDEVSPDNDCPLCINRNLVYVWTTTDFISFDYLGLKNASDEPLLAKASDRVELPSRLADNIDSFWTPQKQKVAKKRFPFPLVEGFADPVVFKWKNKWYYIATNDLTNAVGLYVRESDTVDGLFDVPSYRLSVILDYDEEHGFCQTFWAPEFHVIGGRLCILFAVSGKAWGPQSHIMRLKDGGDVMNPDDWELPVRVGQRPGITLDMTHFAVGGHDYLVWSERYKIGTPYDSGSMLYIAETNPQEPWNITGEPVLIGRPLYGWENQSGTINNEGPYPLILGKRIYLAYSGGAAGGFSYTVGYLMADADSNLLDADSWKKTPSPVLTGFTDPNEEGPGHNAFFTDDNGDIYVTYHAQRPGQDYRRCTAIRKVVINSFGFPLLDAVEEEI